MTNTYVWIWSDELSRPVIFMAGRDTVEEAREELLDWLMNDKFFDDILASNEVDEKFKDRLIEKRGSQRELLLGSPSYQTDGGNFQIIFHL